MDAYNNTVIQLRATRGVTASRDSSDGRRNIGLVGDIQSELKTKGYYNGKIDGQYGRGTRSAIIAYQNANNLVADGEPTEYFLRHLKSQP